MINSYQDTHGFSRKNYNSFYTLMNYSIICYNYNNFGHIEKYYRSNNKQVSPIMKRSWEQKKENYLFFQETLHTHKNKDKWVIESGLSSHMIGDKTNFITSKKNEGKFTFVDNGRSKIVRKGTLSLEKEIAKIEKVLCVEDLKHNLLSVSQMCDQGHNIMFNS
jgi:hypothetical protein